MLGALFRAESARDLLLGLGRADIAFGLVVRGWDLEVVREAQHVVLAIAKYFQQDATDGLGDGLGRPGIRRIWDSPTRTPCRKLFIHIAWVPALIAWWPCSRARLAAWIRPRSAVWI